MNRRKKGNQILKARAKRAKAKLAPKNRKPKYICKADRAKMAAEAALAAAQENRQQSTQQAGCEN